MKTNKKPSPAKESTAAKLTPAVTSRSKTKRVKIETLNTAAPQDQDTPPVAHSASEVALRAYHNFQKRGSGDGDHTDDWLRAEAELASEGRPVCA